MIIPSVLLYMHASAGRVAMSASGGPVNCIETMSDVDWDDRSEPLLWTC